MVIQQNTFQVHTIQKEITGTTWADLGERSVHGGAKRQLSCWPHGWWKPLEMGNLQPLQGPGWLLYWAVIESTELAGIHRCHSDGWKRGSAGWVCGYLSGPGRWPWALECPRVRCIRYWGLFAALCWGGDLSAHRIISPGWQAGQLSGSGPLDWEIMQREGEDSRFSEMNSLSSTDMGRGRSWLSQVSWNRSGSWPFLSPHSSTQVSPVMRSAPQKWAASWRASFLL